MLHQCYHRRQWAVTTITVQIMYRLINYFVVIGSSDANSVELPLTFEMEEVMAQFVTKNYDMMIVKSSNYVRVEREINYLKCQGGNCCCFPG